MGRSNSELLEKVEALRNVLTSRATGEGSNDLDYARLRKELLGSPEVRDRLPRFVRTCYTLGDFWNVIKPQIATYQGRREFLRTEFAPLLDSLETPEAASDPAISTSLRELAPEQVHALWRKALDRRLHDPEGAITAARTLLEAVLKHVLEEKSVVYDEKWDLPKLHHAAAKALHLAPEQHDEELFRQILGGCQTVVVGLGKMRDSLGDAHGRPTRRAKPAPRHAALAVNLAGGVATFFVETLADRKNRRLDRA